MASGVLGGIGSIHNVCHSLCVTVVSILAIFGITTSILPLMFLQTYQMYFWLGALIFTTVSLYFYLKHRKPIARDRNLLLINAGLLLFGLPFFKEYSDFFRFLGGSLTTLGILALFLGGKFQLVHRPTSEMNEYVSPQTQTLRDKTAPMEGALFPKISISSLLFVIIAGAFLINQYLLWRLTSSSNTVLGSAQKTEKKSNMRLTPFDIALARERMDKNKDGACDECGMSIQQCIDTGQIDCNMGSKKDAIGVLDSQHIHADFKVYINGEALDFAKPEFYMKSSFLHVDPNLQHREEEGNLLHMHAKNVPLWLFFRSIGMRLEQDMLLLPDGSVLNNQNGHTLKLYVNGRGMERLDDYVFQNRDKLLISYGPEKDPHIEKQIQSVTDFAKHHK